MRWSNSAKRWAAATCARGKPEDLSSLDVGLRFESKLAGSYLPHPEFLYLAADRDGKFLDELNVARDLEACDPALAKPADIFRGQRSALFQLDPGGDLFAVFAVRDTNDLYIADARASVEELFNLARGNVFSAAYDDILRPTGDLEVPALVKNREVARPQPAIFVDYSTSRLGILVVAFHDMVAASIQLTFRAKRNGSAGLRTHDLDLGMRQSLADRGNPKFDGIVGGGLCDHGRSLESGRRQSSAGCSASG